MGRPDVPPGPPFAPPAPSADAAAKGGKKPKRNDPCPCKSGKKYKQCCGVGRADGGGGAPVDLSKAEALAAKLRAGGCGGDKARPVPPGYEVPADCPSRRKECAMKDETTGPLAGLRKELKQMCEVLPADHPDIASAHYNIGILLAGAGDHVGALSEHQLSLAIRQTALPPDSPLIATSHDRIGTSLYALGKDGEALAELRKALDMRNRVLDPLHLDIASSHNNIGVVLTATKAHSEALEEYKKCLKIRLKSLPAEHLDLAAAYNRVGTAKYALQDFSGAVDDLRKCLEMRIKLCPDVDEDVEASHGTLAVALEAVGDHSEVRLEKEKAEQVKKRRQVLEEMTEELPDGTAVKVLGLSGAAHLNGIHGTVSGSQGDRLGVLLPPPYGRKALKRENIVRVRGDAKPWDGLSDDQRAALKGVTDAEAKVRTRMYDLARGRMYQCLGNTMGKRLAAGTEPHPAALPQLEAKLAALWGDALSTPGLVAAPAPDRDADELLVEEFDPASVGG